MAAPRITRRSVGDRDLRESEDAAQPMLGVAMIPVVAHHWRRLERTSANTPGSSSTASIAMSCPCFTQSPV
jgi:hypothetical protein